MREREEIEAALSDCLRIHREYHAATLEAQHIHVGTVIALAWVLRMKEGDSLIGQLRRIRETLDKQIAPERRQ